ncbi:hypothetical protein ACFLYO_06155 [Chloroflexota bacterium]
MKKDSLWREFARMMGLFLLGTVLILVAVLCLFGLLGVVFGISGPT